MDFSVDTIFLTLSSNTFIGTVWEIKILTKRFIEAPYSGEAMASWLGHTSPDRAVLGRALAEDIVLCSWAR